MIPECIIIIKYTDHNMPLHLSEFQRGMIAGAYEMCHNASVISKTLKLPRSTVRFWITRYVQSKTVERKSGSG